MPLLPGILASAQQAHISSGNFYLISSQTLSSLAASVSFSSIPSTYRSLQLRCQQNRSNATGSRDIYVQFNSDTGTNYTSHLIYGTGSAVSAVSSDAATYGTIFGATDPTGVGSFIMDISDYASTTKYKTMFALGGMVQTSTPTGYASINSAAWKNTAAITSITLTQQNYFVGSSQSIFSLYGVI